MVAPKSAIEPVAHNAFEVTGELVSISLRILYT